MEKGEKANYQIICSDGSNFPLADVTEEVAKEEARKKAEDQSVKVELRKTSGPNTGEQISF